MYSATRRTQLESALIRVIRDLGVAEVAADSSGDEGAVEDLVSMKLTAASMLRQSQQDRRSAALPKQIKGQTSLS